MTSARPSGSSARSYTLTQFGWLTTASARASRCMRSAVSRSGACAIFSATVRLSWVSTACQTVPKPPAPSCLTRR